MLQVIDELSGRLEKRESQLLTVSKDKARLEEECDNLKEYVHDTHPVLNGIKLFTVTCYLHINISFVTKWLDMMKPAWILDSVVFSIY